MSKPTYADYVSTKATPQSEPVPGKPTVANNAGGYAFAVDDWTRLDRFLILGSEGGTYYVKEKVLTVANADVVLRCLAADGLRTVARIVAVSDEGRAPKNDPAIFALVLAAANGSPEVKAAALRAVPAVCRIGTHLFQFVAASDKLRGWGRGLRRAVLNWYTSKDDKALAYQLMKYQQRDGWSHRDVLRLAGGGSNLNTPLLRWAVGADQGERQVKRLKTVDGKLTELRTDTYPATGGELPTNIQAFEELKKETDPKKAAAVIREHRLVRECVPTQFLTSAEVWDALLADMPVTAMVRNLGTMTKVGLIAPLSDAERTVADRLRDVDRLKKGRVHPLSLLVALKTYASGHGIRGGATWTPSQAIVGALNDAFYLAFDAIEPASKRFVFGVDVSGSMSSLIAGLPVSCCEAAAVLSLVSARTEPYTFIGRFNTGFQEVPFGKTTRLDDVLRHTSSINGGGTDCALPMVWAKENEVPADTFVVLTDSETWAGRIHPFQALKQYRDAMGIPAKLVVVGMTATEFTIADPSDAGMLDVVGFSTDAPAVMADFARN